MIQFEERFVREYLAVNRVVGDFKVIELMQLYERFAEQSTGKKISIFNKFNPTGCRNYKLFERFLIFLKENNYPPKGFLQAQFFRRKSGELPFTNALRSLNAEKNFKLYLDDLNKRAMSVDQIHEVIYDVPITKRLEVMKLKDRTLINCTVAKAVELIQWDDFVSMNLPDFSLAFHFTHPEFPIFKELYYNSLKPLQRELSQFEEAYKREIITAKELTDHFVTLKLNYNENHKTPLKTLSTTEYFYTRKDLLKAKFEVEGFDSIVKFIQDDLEGYQSKLDNFSWKTTLKKILVS